jgi:hypothetical protein
LLFFFWLPSIPVLTATRLSRASTFAERAISLAARLEQPPFRESSRTGGRRWRDHPCTARLRDTGDPDRGRDGGLGLDVAR